MTRNEKVLVLGASTDPSRFSYKAITLLKKLEFEIYAIGKHNAIAQDVPIYSSVPAYQLFNAVTVYLSPKWQEEYIEYILKNKPKRVIFNPGTENPDVYDSLEAEGIEVIEACTLVMLKTGQF